MNFGDDDLHEAPPAYRTGFAKRLPLMKVLSKFFLNLTDVYLLAVSVFLFASELFLKKPAINLFEFLRPFKLKTVDNLVFDSTLPKT